MRLPPLWTAALAARLPCHPLYLDWTREHVVPKSIVKLNDFRNIVPLPRKLNQARGNRPYTNDYEDGYFVYACENCPNPGFCQGVMVMSPSGAHPPNAFKGPIARSVLHTAFKYPSMAKTVHESVLDINTAIEWDRKFPATEDELDWIRRGNQS